VELPDLDWETLRVVMAGAHGRSAAWAEVGRWALDTLAERLGPAWPSTVRAKSPDGNAPELGLAAAHVIAYTSLVERALRLVLLEEVPGRADLRRVIERDPRPEQLVHADLQLEVAALALRADLVPELEPAGGTPADVAFTANGRRIVVEARAVLPDNAWREDNRRTDEVFERVQAIEIASGVRVEGIFGRLLDTDEIEDVLGRVAAHARLVAAGGAAPPLRIHGADLRVVDRSSPPRSGLTGPSMTGDAWTRVGRRIAEKAAQARGSGATWLRLDARNGLWQFTRWSQQSLAAKLDALIALAVGALGGLEGVVLSSGALLRQGTFKDEEVLRADGAVALRRLVAPLRVRETLVVPAGRSVSVGEASAAWRELYANEDEWLAWGLERVGLPSPEDVFAW
jgi:hypothetical protein